MRIEDKKGGRCELPIFLFLELINYFCYNNYLNSTSQAQTHSSHLERSERPPSFPTSMVPFIHRYHPNPL